MFKENTKSENHTNIKNQ